MGGASTQIAFQPTPTMAALHANDLTRIKLKTQEGSELDYQLFVTTFLGYGVNQARTRWVATLNEKRTLQDPCLPKGYSEEGMTG